VMCRPFQCAWRQARLPLSNSSRRRPCS